MNGVAEKRQKHFSFRRAEANFNPRATKELGHLSRRSLVKTSLNYAFAATSKSSSDFLEIIHLSFLELSTPIRTRGMNTTLN